MTGLSTMTLFDCFIKSYEKVEDLRNRASFTLFAYTSTPQTLDYVRAKFYRKHRQMDVFYDALEERLTELEEKAQLYDKALRIGML